AQQNAQGAADAFSAALKLRPDSPEALRGLGQALQALGQLERAAASYQKAIAINGNDVAALNNLAWILADGQKNPDKALPLATKALDLAPQQPEVMDTLGWIHYLRGSYPEAEKLLVGASEKIPNNAVIQYHLGMTYSRMGKRGDAVSALRRAAQIDPKLAQTERISDRIRELGG
ncbi:MAG: tetratricopeptide repeat protein, partial [Candidatus Rokubacteria bacterium]|nr:tetratricopeptide repeat protein [Candidatus Rokubacteria bacterium]